MALGNLGEGLQQGKVPSTWLWRAHAQKKTVNYVPIDRYWYIIFKWIWRL